MGEVAEAEGGAAEVFEASVVASVGLLLVPGRSKYARTSTARFFSVRPSVITSVTAPGTPRLTLSMSWVISSAAGPPT